MGTGMITARHGLGDWPGVAGWRELLDSSALAPNEDEWFPLLQLSCSGRRNATSWLRSGRDESYSQPLRGLAD